MGLMAAAERRTSVNIETAVRNQFYFEIMRLPPHYPWTGNITAPADATFSDAHVDAYESSPFVEDADMQQIRDVLLKNVNPL